MEAAVAPRLLNLFIPKSAWKVFIKWLPSYLLNGYNRDFKVPLADTIKCYLKGCSSLSKCIPKMFLT